jgi:two-component system, NarL family, invasion response regulator UvrY
MSISYTYTDPPSLVSTMKILIADDHEIVRKGLKQILMEHYAGASIVEVSDGLQLVEMAMTDDWDIVISDISMPKMNGVEALKKIKDSKPELRVLMLSIHSEDQYALRVFKAGAHGYMTKDMAEQELVKAVEKVITGKKFISPSFAEKLAEALDAQSGETTHEALSDREFHVFKFLATGKSISEIATTMGLNVSTVSTYRSRIFEKMGMKSNADITRYCIEKGII